MSSLSGAAVANDTMVPILPPAIPDGLAAALGVNVKELDLVACLPAAPALDNDRELAVVAAAALQEPAASITDELLQRQSDGGMCMPEFGPTVFLGGFPTF